MIVYHGSNKEVVKPIYKGGKSYNDYGNGFYLTESKEMAKEWASDSLESGFVNEYFLDLDKLKVLDLRDNKYNILHWLALLLKNRKFSVTSQMMEASKSYLLENFLLDVSEYDVIIGYRADDSYFSFSKDFLANTISLQKLSKAMKLGNLGSQIFIQSKKAFNNIKFIKSEKICERVYYQRKINRDIKAREKYKTIKEEIRRGLYMIDILKEGIKDDDKRLHY